MVRRMPPLPRRSPVILRTRQRAEIARQAERRLDDDAAQWRLGLCGILSAILVRHLCAGAGTRCRQDTQRCAARTFWLPGLRHPDRRRRRLQCHAASPDTSFAVFGAGSVGLAGMMAAKVAGCEPIIAVDVRANRLALARELGATYIVDNGRENAVAAIRQITGGGADHIFETSALPAVFREAVDCLVSCGTCVLAASAPRGTEVSFEMPVLQAGRTVRGVIQGDSRPEPVHPLSGRSLHGRPLPARPIGRFL
jgi:Zinc-binding dehydrogenase